MKKNKAHVFIPNDHLFKKHIKGMVYFFVILTSHSCLRKMRSYKKILEKKTRVFKEVMYFY